MSLPARYRIVDVLETGPGGEDLTTLGRVRLRIEWFVPGENPVTAWVMTEHIVREDALQHSAFAEVRQIAAASRSRQETVNGLRALRGAEHELVRGEPDRPVN